MKTINVLVQVDSDDNIIKMIKSFSDYKECFSYGMKYSREKKLRMSIDLEIHPLSLD